MDVPVRLSWSIKVTEELEHLWALHALDQDLVKARAVLEQLPGRKKELGERLVAESTRLEQVKAKLMTLQKARHEREQLIQAAAEQEHKFRNQLNMVKKNEEYTALLHEIEGVKAKRSDLETEVLVQLEEEETFEKERPDAERALADAKKEVEARRQEIEREEREQQAVIDAIQARRDAHLEKLSPRTRQRYTRIHESRRGVAVVAIAKDACGGCFRALPPQLLVEARRGDQLLTCEGCGRLIVWPPNGASI
jgi:predicted  nucleic acid-binding Zn-ribbon protein